MQIAGASSHRSVLFLFQGLGLTSFFAFVLTAFFDILSRLRPNLFSLSRRGNGMCFPKLGAIAEWSGFSDDVSLSHTTILLSVFPFVNALHERAMQIPFPFPKAAIRRDSFMIVFSDHFGGVALFYNAPIPPQHFSGRLGEPPTDVKSKVLSDAARGAPFFSRSPRAPSMVTASIRKIDDGSFRLGYSILHTGQVLSLHRVTSPIAPILMRGWVGGGEEFFFVGALGFS